MQPRSSDAVARARSGALALAGALAGLALLSALLPAYSIFSGSLGYAEFHLVLELASVLVSLLVFAVGWNAFTEGAVREQLLLSCGFLAVALIDLVHALSFRGMPPLVTESSPQKAIAFWLAARTVMAATMLAVALRISPRIPRSGALALALGISALTIWFGLWHEDLLPPTFVPGQGLTPFKVHSELGLIAAFAAAAVLFGRRAGRESVPTLWWLAGASAVCGLAETFFCRYVEVSDIYNVLGHLYKIIAFAIIYAVVFVTGMRAPYREVRALEGKFRAAFDQAFQYMGLVSVDGRLLELNQTAQAAAQAPRERWAGAMIWEAPWWDTQAVERARIEAAVRQAAQGQSVRFEVQYKALDGSARFADFSIKPFRGSDGEVESLIAEGRDVTERRRREEELRLRDDRMQEAIRVSNVGIFDHDHVTDRIYWSPEQRAIYGWTADEEVSLGKFLEHVYGADREAVGAAVQRAHAPGGDGRFDIEHRIVRRDGKVRWLKTRSQSRFEGEGAARRLVRTIGAVLDITDRKDAEDELRSLNTTLEHRVAARTAELEEALRTLARAQDELVSSAKLAALGSLVAGVAHELNTPLGNALMVASTLRDKSAQFAREAAGDSLRRSRLQEYVEMSVQAAGLVMHNLTQAADLVSSFKQVAVDQASAKRREFDLKETVEEVISTGPHLARRPPVRIRAELAGDLRLDSYPGPLGQVLNNLLSNAMDHAFAGPVSGEIAIRTAPQGDDAVVLEFADNGAGIDPAHLPKIFDPFFTTRFGQGGSGLGLNIVHNIVTGVLGGRILVDSEPGRGTRFTLTLPRVAPRAGAAPAPVPAS